MKRLCTLSLLTISLWLAPIVQAQPQRLRFELLNVEAGLSQGTIFSMTQDRRGFLWFGTDNGLNRYDGYTFKVYASVPFDTTSLLPEAISDIEEAHDGALWIASTYQGVSRFDPATETATHYRHDPEDPNSVSEGTFHAVLEARDGAIWVGTRQGLSRMDPAAPGRFTHYKHDPADSTSLSHSVVRFLFEDAAGTMWVSTPNGLNRMNPTVPGRFTRYLEEPDDIEFLFSRIRRIYEDPDAPGVLWVGSRNGLVRLDTETGEVERYHPNPDNSDANVVADVTPDPTTPGVLWATVPNLGIVRFDVETGAFTPYRHDPRKPHSLPNNKTGSILTDRAGVVWIGHADGGGISRFDATAGGFQIFLHNPNSLAEVSVWSIHEDREGGLWVGSVDGGNPSLRQIDRATNELTTWISSHGFLPPPQEDTALPSGIIYDIAEDPEGYLWLGTSNGLDRFDPVTNRFTHYRHDHADSTTLSGDRVFDLLDGHDGTFWVAIVGGHSGVNRFDPATGTVTSFLNTAGSGVLSLFKDQAGMLWAGLNGDGVVQLNPATGETTHYRHNPTDTTTITSGYVYGMVERAMEPGVLWIALSPGGLNRFDTRTGVFTHYTTEDGLPDNTIYALLEDEEGYLWISTNRGLARFDPDTEEVRSFGLEHGLQGLEFHAWASAKGRDGELFFGGVNGLNAFYPSQITENQTPPQVALTGFRLFNKPVKPGPGAPLKVALSKTEEIRLRHGEDHIDFDYVALHYKNSSQNHYAYRLDGFDRDWIDAGTNRTATYTNLPPGHYTFRVKAANSDGVWNEEGAAVKLTVLPPWWRTWWAYVLYGLFFIGGVISVDRVQRRRLLEGERRRAALREAHLRTEAAEHLANYLQSENERQTQELEQARALQLSMLPAHVPEHPTVEIAAFMKTATEVGGDYYDFDFSEDGTLTIIIGDATGHGASAGTMVTATKGILNVLAGEEDLEQVLRAASEAVRRMHLPKLYMALALVRLRDHTLELVGAGMPPALVYRAASGCVEEVPLKGMPLGSPGMYPYRRQCLLLSPGDTVVLMSDGFPELLGASGQRLGYDRMPGLFAEAAARSPEEVIAHLMETAKAWCNGQGPDDDMTFIVIKVKA